MLTHYIDFDVIEGAEQSDVSRLHGRILSASHTHDLGINAFDFVNWKASYAGTVLRIFATQSKLENLLSALTTLITAGAITHNGIKPIPADATQSEYTYTRSKTQVSHSSSAKRRYLKRNPDKVWRNPDPSAAKPPTGYRVIMLSQSNGNVYPVYINRSPYNADKDINGIFHFRIPAFTTKAEQGDTSE